MDIVEVNKRTGSKLVFSARNNLYNCKSVNKEDSLTLMLYACKKLYGLQKTVKIIHGLGVKNI